MKQSTNASVLNILRITGILVLITTVTAVLLAVINNFTAPVIEENAAKAKEEAIFSLFAEADTSKNISDDYASLFPESVSALFAVYKGDSLLGYVADIASMGFNDNIGMMIGVNATENTVRGIRVMSISDTPGLGMKVAEDGYLSTFNGRDYADASDVITGATYSSNGIINGVNDVLALCTRIDVHNHITTESVETEDLDTAAVTTEDASETTDTASASITEQSTEASTEAEIASEEVSGDA